MLDIKLLLVPVDFSAGSRAAVDYAALIAAKLGAGVELFHVWNPPTLVPENLLVIAPSHTNGPGFTLEDLARSRAETELKEFQGILKARGVTSVHTRVG